eukprot:654409-Rhodomonas_salina.1
MPWILCRSRAPAHASTPSQCALWRTTASSLPSSFSEVGAACSCAVLSEAETDTDTDTDAETGAETETGAGAGAGAEAECGPGCNREAPASKPSRSCHDAVV